MIFDIDGTLVDTNDAHIESWHRVFREFGFSVPRERIDVEVGKGGDKLLPSILGEEVEQRLGRDIRDGVTAEFLRIATSTRFRVFPGVAELLAELRDRRLGVALATSSKQEQLDAIQRSAGISLISMVDHVITKDDARESKPAPDLVVAALDKLGVLAGESVMVGDTPYDGEASARAGVPFVGVLCGGRDSRLLERAGARHVWRDPAELLEKLDLVLRAA
ncbi:MAG: HAD family hydrolase [Gemmatimonadota bacterium]|nr:HAD family hydrolase [Gemmatimonadota bacterium]